jgi:hypothetical protein
MMAPTVAPIRLAPRLPHTSRALAPRPSLLNCYREARVGRRPAGVRREAVEDPWRCFPRRDLSRRRSRARRGLSPWRCFPRRGPRRRLSTRRVFFLGDAILLATSDDFFFCSPGRPLFFVKPEAAPPRAPSKAPATTPLGLYRPLLSHLRRYEEDSQRASFLPLARTLGNQIRTPCRALLGVILVVVLILVLLGRI